MVELLGGSTEDPLGDSVLAKKIKTGKIYILKIAW